MLKLSKFKSSPILKLMNLKSKSSEPITLLLTLLSGFYSSVLDAKYNKLNTEQKLH